MYRVVRTIAMATAVAGGVIYIQKTRFGSALSHERAPVTLVGLQAKRFEDEWPRAAADLRRLTQLEQTRDAQVLAAHGTEMSGHATPAAPHIVVYPRSIDDVQRVVRVAAAHGVPLVAYAAGTSVEGHTVAPRGGICVDFSRMNRVLEVNEDDMDCTVEPGIGWVELNELLAPKRLMLGVDPAPGAMIGGMCGTCCSGTRAVRYGTMRQQVLSLLVVTADGTLVQTGTRARKSSAGYGLSELFVGSEGTLGLVVRATLRLRPVPPVERVARVQFPSVAAAAAAAAAIMRAGATLGAVELMDGAMCGAVNQYTSDALALDATRPLLLMKIQGVSARGVDDELALIERLAAVHGGSAFAATRDDAATRQLWQARKAAFWAAQAARPTRVLMATDVAVPLSRLAECIDATRDDIARTGLFAPIVGHVGDGNFHACIMYDAASAAETATANALHDRMVQRAIALGGTCTGEHGVGIGKKRYLATEKGDAAVALMRRLKHALDPRNILNPEKIIDF